MIEAAEHIIDFVGDLTPEELSQDQLRLDAVLWNFTVLGEAATQVSAETKALYNHVDWRRPAGLRNRIVTDTGRLTSRSS